MSLPEQIAAAWARTGGERLAKLRASLIEPDPTPTYSRLDRMDGLGR